MEYTSAILFFSVLIGILWKMKADYLFVLFSLTAYLFLLLYIFNYNPTDLSSSVVNLVSASPNRFFILLFTLVAPLVIDYLYGKIKKRYSNSNIS